MENKLEYINEGRGGYVIYKDGQGEIKLSFEFGGSDCIVIINVPPHHEWTARTHRPVGERQSILTFVAEQSIKDQAPGSYYELSDRFIGIFDRKR